MIESVGNRVMLCLKRDEEKVIFQEKDASGVQDEESSFKR